MLKAVSTALTGLLAFGAAQAAENSLECNNPRRAYVATFDDVAKTFLVTSEEGTSEYEVAGVDNKDGAQIVRGTTLNDGPDFVAHLTNNPRIEFVADDEIIQTDTCRLLP